jgi:FkbM family methyltransferase
MHNIIGYALRSTPSFRGKGRLYRLWVRLLPKGDCRTALLPDGSSVNVQMDIPYERMVWLRAEEWDELCYLQHKLQRGDVFIDVGANIGLWTLVAASAVGSTGRVFSFEPNPTTFTKLRANICLNKRTTIVETFQNAVSGSEGLLDFACAAEHNISAISDKPNGPNTIRVRTVSLDSLLSAQIMQGHVAGIKLDTEGHELPGLHGALRLIETCSPWLIVEFNTVSLDSEALQDWTVYQFLTALEYQPFVYKSTGEESRVNGTLSVRGYRNILFQRTS